MFMWFGCTDLLSPICRSAVSQIGHWRGLKPVWRSWKRACIRRRESCWRQTGAPSLSSPAASSFPLSYTRCCPTIKLYTVCVSTYFKYVFTLVLWLCCINTVRLLLFCFPGSCYLQCSGWDQSSFGPHDWGESGGSGRSQRQTGPSTDGQRRQ